MRRSLGLAIPPDCQVLFYFNVGRKASPEDVGRRDEVEVLPEFGPPGWRIFRAKGSRRMRCAGAVHERYRHLVADGAVRTKLIVQLRERAPKCPPAGVSLSEAPLGREVIEKHDGVELDWPAPRLGTRILPFEHRFRNK